VWTFCSIPTLQLLGAEFDGGLPRAEAEARAFECCVVERLNRNFVRAPPGRCVSRGEVEQSHDPLQPFGIEPTGPAWLHSRCWVHGTLAEGRSDRGSFKP
jgi:hypothetical protein